MFLRVRASRERAQMVFHQAGKAGPAFASHPFAYPNRSRIQQEILASLHVRTIGELCAFVKCSPFRFERRFRFKSGC